jgi:hypothetical protein
MKGMNYFLMILFLSIENRVTAQHKDSFALQLYGELYASSVPNQPFNKLRPAFQYNYTKANEAGVNMALARVHYSTQRFRTNFGLMAGDYPAANLADEPEWTRHFFEVNAGYKLSSKEELWLDAGLFPSHIGIETAIGKDNWAATRSIVADNSPYYETGIRLGYRPNAKWYGSMLILTGWQNITIPYGQRGAGWGLQVTYTPNAKVSINHSSFIGDVVTPSGNGTRIYFHHNAAITINTRSAIALGWDLGLQGSNINQRETDVWNGWLLLYRYLLKPGKWTAAFRYERFIDNRNVLFSINSPAFRSFNLHQSSLNLDWQPFSGLLLRGEFNYQQAPRPLFYKGSQLTQQQLSAFLIASYNFQYSKKR